jgi:enamine deaminase RidA (YjgF/YER057c/UK114 family)
MAGEHPYSLAFEKDGIVYVSGAAAVDADHNPILGDRECIEAALDAVEKRLGVLGLGLEHVVKTSFFVTDVNLRDEANRAYQERFAEPRPARTFVEVSAIPYGARVALEAVAHRPRD